ncbi:NAD-dependent epimerase/dehydratase family protein [Zhouia sp. PK063]|uniref:NAD-dependent epimerase/dehydratase family protein n=1 Tax=Zhouia sp. PK063 TaxID=3373602 RepID=UPI0037AF786E
MNKTAIILGATGLTGNFVLKYLLENEAYERVIIFNRKHVGFTHPKLEEHLIDVLRLEHQKEQFIADEVYCCIGTTRKKTPDKATYRKIDYGIPVSAARLCYENKIPTFLIISALGATAQSKIFYSRLKGEMEDAVRLYHIPKTHFLRPALIAGKRKEKRAGEWFFKQLMKIMNFIMVGPLDKYKSITPEYIAKAMIWLANHDHEHAVVKSDEIRKIAQL